jgi:SpoVK/Ycf46/Vps4 family AAA+-type ATPase
MTMATAEQIKALVRSYGARDDDQFVAVALQIAAQAARAGKEKLAKELQSLVDEAQSRQRVNPPTRNTPLARPMGELAGLVTASYPKVRLADMVLATETRDKLDKIVVEYRQGEKLRHHGLSPRRKLLLVGPPGCGKTMSASAVAAELGLPLLAVQLHALMSRYLGETAAKLHLVFDAMQRQRAVYLFDEFDAIGAHRSGGNDVGEVRRVLNSFLQFLELEDSDSVIIAATNFVQMLDEALFRRFDDVIQYALPTEAEREFLMRNRLSVFGVSGIDWPAVVAAANGLSHAEIARACDEAAKNAVLSDFANVTTGGLQSALTGRMRPKH